MRKAKWHKIPASECPYCGYKPQGELTVTTKKGGKVQPGTLTFCVKCYAMVELDEAMHFIKPSNEKIDSLTWQEKEQIEIVIEILKGMNRQ